MKKKPTKKQIELEKRKQQRKDRVVKPNKPIPKRARMLDDMDKKELEILQRKKAIKESKLIEEEDEVLKILFKELEEIKRDFKNYTEQQEFNAEIKELRKKSVIEDVLEDAKQITNETKRTIIIKERVSSFEINSANPIVKKVLTATTETMLNSFEKLAYVWAQSEEEKNKVEEILKNYKVEFARLVSYLALDGYDYLNYDYKDYLRVATAFRSEHINEEVARYFIDEDPGVALAIKKELNREIRRNQGKILMRVSGNNNFEKEDIQALRSIIQYTENESESATGDQILVIPIPDEMFANSYDNLIEVLNKLFLYANDNNIQAIQQIIKMLEDDLYIKKNKLMSEIYNGGTPLPYLNAWGTIDGIKVGE